MSGLDQILNTIRQDSEQQIRTIEQKAMAEEEILRRAADKDAAFMRQRLHEEGERKCARRIAQAKSAAQASVRSAALQARADSVAAVLAAALQTLEALPTDEYFALIQKLLLPLLRPAQGTLLLRQADIDRMPQDFLQKLQSASAGGSVRVAPTQQLSGGGFLLRYGKVTENMAFSELFITQHEELSALAARVLFEGADV